MPRFCTDSATANTPARRSRRTCSWISVSYTTSVMPSVAPTRNSIRNAVVVTVECEITNISPAVVRNDRKIERRATLSRCMKPVRSSLQRKPTPSIASA